MPEVVGIRFKRAGRIYFFDPGALDLAVDELVIVETARGTEIGRVAIGRRQVVENEITEPLKPVVRRAESEDLRKMSAFKAKEQDALRKCREKVAHHGLPMKLVGAEYNFDGSRLTFFFTADGRVDFRELVKDLAATFRTRIELRQIGVRDEAKYLGGLGRCGRALCCTAFLGEFEPVSIKMAKDQDLPLNPMKISGLCGRLLCCLSYENEHYCDCKQRMPKLGEEVDTPKGSGFVVAINVLKESVTVELQSGATIESSVSELTCRHRQSELARNSSHRRRRK